MSLLRSCVAILTLCFACQHVSCYVSLQTSPQVSMVENKHSNNRTKIDLQAFLDDLTVAAHSMHYTVNLNSRLLEELKTRLLRSEVSCEVAGAAVNVSDEINDFLNKDNRVKFFHIRDKTYGLLRTPQTWNEARKACVNIGGKLVDIKSRAQGEALAQNFEKIKVKKSEAVYIGIHSLFDKNDWVTITGEPVAQSLNWKLMSNVTVVGSSLQAADSSRNCGILMDEIIDKADCNDKHIAVCKL